MSKERTVVEHCEDYADEHDLSAVTDHQHAMRLKAENANLKAKNAELEEELRVGNHLLAVATDKQRDLDIEIMQLKRALRDTPNRSDMDATIFVCKKLKAENGGLKVFIREFVSVECWNLPPEVDGGDVQEVAEKMGIIVPVKATQQQTDDLNEEHGIDLEEGDTIYNWSDLMKD